jgi:hypothetical protein
MNILYIWQNRLIRVVDVRLVNVSMENVIHRKNGERRLLEKDVRKVLANVEIIVVIQRYNPFHNISVLYYEIFYIIQTYECILFHLSIIYHII